MEGCRSRPTVCTMPASVVQRGRELSQVTATMPFPLGIVAKFGIYPKHYQACDDDERTRADKGENIHGIHHDSRYTIFGKVTLRERNVL